MLNYTKKTVTPSFKKNKNPDIDPKKAGFPSTTPNPSGPKRGNDKPSPKK